MAEKNPALRVEFFGDFAVTVGDCRVAESSRKSTRIWKLIKYLAAHKNRIVPQNELLDIFCRDDNRGNPGSMLRTMVYRARGMLADGGIENAARLITAKTGGYMWSGGTPCATDTDEFEELIKQAKTERGKQKKLELLLEAAELYKGDFLKNISGEVWVIPISRRYRESYMRVIYESLELLVEFERFMEAERLVTEALRIDPFDEVFIESYLKTLLALNKNKEAFEEYKKMESMFYDELGIRFSEDLRALYGEIRQTEAGAEHVSLHEMVKSWLDNIIDAPHVYYCDSGDFKMLCQIEALSASRTGNTAFVIRFDTRHGSNPKPAAKGGGIMKELERAITSCLRASDIYTRYSPSQYLILLRKLTYEDCKMLVSRILNRLQSKSLPEIVNTSIMYITPASEFFRYHTIETSEDL